MPALTVPSQPLHVDVTTPGVGPFCIVEHGPRDATGKGSFAVTLANDPYRWPWFVATDMTWTVAVCAALNAVVAK